MQNTLAQQILEMVKSWPMLQKAVRMPQPLVAAAVEQRRVEQLPLRFEASL